MIEESAVLARLSAGIAAGSVLHGRYDAAGPHVGKIMSTERDAGPQPQPKP